MRAATFGERLFAGAAGDDRSLAVAARHPAAARGFTLIEGMIASAVLAIAVVGVAGVLATAHQQSKGQQENATALALANQLMEEIAARPVALSDGSTGAAGWPTATNRAGYDTIDDYSGYTDTTSSLKTLSGQALSVASSGELYTRKVTVTSGVRPLGHTVAPAGDFVLVKVTVTPPIGSGVTLSQLFTRTSVSR